MEIHLPVSVQFYSCLGTCDRMERKFDLLIFNKVIHILWEYDGVRLATNSKEGRARFLETIVP